MRGYTTEKRGSPAQNIAVLFKGTHWFTAETNRKGTALVFQASEIITRYHCEQKQFAKVEASGESCYEEECDGQDEEEKEEGERKPEGEARAKKGNTAVVNSPRPIVAWLFTCDVASHPLCIEHAASESRWGRTPVLIQRISALARLSLQSPP